MLGMRPADTQAMPILLTTVAGTAVGTAIIVIKVVLSCLEEFTSDVAADQVNEGDGLIAVPV